MRWVTDRYGGRPRGGSNLCERPLRATARGFVCEKGEIKRVIKGGRSRLLYFCAEGGVKMPTKSNNIGGRGGARPGAGRKKSAVKDKAENGNPGGRKLEVLDIPEVEGVDMPKPHDFLSAEQRDGSQLQAEEIYKETWEWLQKVGCAAKVSPQLLERYAMCSARWIQCEEMTNRMGFLSKHPTTQKPIPSPFINIGINYMNQAVRLWNEIFQIVKENCSTDYGDVSPQDDLMERLLRARKG
ncbi:MAG: terminase [Muribaculaceae bacterium]|nr:terminase [Muribaculaceae bacterium]